MLAKRLINSNKSIRLALQSASKKPFSTINSFGEKERAEESRYIKSLEQKRAEEIKEKLAHILAQEDSSQQKAELLKVIDSTKEPTFYQKYGLDIVENGKLFYPLLGAVGLSLHMKGLLVIHTETYILAAYAAYLGLFYNYLYPTLLETFAESRAEATKTFNDLDNVLKQKIVKDIEDTKDFVGMEKTYKEVYEVVDELSTLQAEALNVKAENEYNEAIQKKLNSLVSLENAAGYAIRQRAVKDVNAQVLNLYTTDKKVKEAALNQALAVLAAGGESLKLGKDVVGETYSSALKNYRETYAKQPAGTDPVLNQLEKDIEAVLTQPVLDATGGNVYETHPVAAHAI